MLQKKNKKNHNSNHVTNWENKRHDLDDFKTSF